MPNIPVYQSQVRPRRPSGANAEAAARIGEIQQRTFQQLGQDVRDIGSMIDEQQGKQETSVISKDWSSEELFLTEDWSKTAAAADPNKIDEVAEEWIEKTLNPRIEAFGANVSSTAGTALRDKLREGMRTTFMRTVYGDRAAITGKAVVTNIDEMGNNNANTARMSPDKMEELIAGTRLAIEEQITAHRRTIGADGAARIRGEVSERIFRNIAMAAALGSAQKNPAEARKALADGKFSPYLTAEQQREVINEIEQQENAAKGEKDRAEAAERQAKQDAANEARSDYTDQIILDPTKVDPRAIVNDPRLKDRGDIKQLLDDNRRQALDRLKGKGDPEADKGPGFWSTYQSVIGGRITDPDQIYRMAGPKGQLSLQGAKELVSLLKSRQADDKTGSGNTQRITQFFTMIKKQIAEDDSGTEIPRRTYGEGDAQIVTPSGPEMAFKFFVDKDRYIKDQLAKGKTLDQLLDRDSPDYVGKGWENYRPKPPAGMGEEYQEPEPVKPRSLWDFFGQLFSGGGTFNIQEFDKVTDADQGRAALRAAVAAGATSREAAAAYALKRGWMAAPSAPKGPQVAPALK